MTVVTPSARGATPPPFPRNKAMAVASSRRGASPARAAVAPAPPVALDAEAAEVAEVEHVLQGLPGFAALAAARAPAMAPASMRGALF